MIRTSQKSLKRQELSIPTRQRQEGAGKDVVKWHLQACCTAHFSSLNYSCGGGERCCRDITIAAGMFWYIAVYKGKLASMSSDEDVCNNGTFYRYLFFFFSLALVRSGNLKFN